MSICDGCIHDEVCGLEDNHEEGIVSCADMIPKDVLDKLRAEIEALNEKVSVDYKICLDKSAVLQIIDKYRIERSE